MPTLPTIKLPFDLPKIDLPTVDFSKFDLPKIDLPTPEQVIDFFKDAALAGSGLASLTAERLADLQKQLVDALRTQLDKVRATV